ncbi:KAP family P-loop domain-containing protein [Chryseobacterium carnipullorum]|uniref:KAP family P-loop NTPase fold protein n=1 Tax=Chryseobacterium carnipullorum TaxID=1124835 RepID=UPI00091AB8E4|nr:P-loop NTPase fold protein [Chryseobacterium carnipullorum]SHM73567.1 KAP family P-loop domain-containing protein [Chryseobacterium carnipullorum]
MHTDLPLKESSTDKLGRHPFAYEIASGLVNSFKENNESIVLGINGTWGSGKSTLLNFIINEVEQLSKNNNQEIIVLRFNPWMFSGQKELQTVFLRELILKLKNNSEKLKNASKKIAEFLEYLNWVNYVHSGAGEALSTLKSIFKKAGKEKELVELKKEIDDILIDSKVKLYITVDDIDRLTPSEITEIFQLIKLNGNFANTIFILAYDQIVVETALEKQFGENGKKYLEKIVQVDYTLPPISREDIARLFIDNLNQLFNVDEITNDIKDLNDSIKDEPFIDFFSSLRDIYRFNNSIKLRLPSIYNELNILDFLLIESLRIFDQKVYNFVIVNKESLVHRSNNSINNFSFRSNHEGQSTEAFIENLKFNDLIIRILKRLFIVDISFSFDAITPEDLIRGKRVANESYFDRYFNLQLSNFDIQENVFDKFINENNPEENEAILKKVQEKRQLFQFLNWVKIKSVGSNKYKQQKIIESILLYSKNISYKKGTFWGSGSELMSLLHYVSDLLYSIDDIEERRNLVFTQVESDIYFSSFFLFDRIVYAYELLEKDKLFSNNEWYYLFKNDKENDKEYINKIIKKRNSIAKELFAKTLINSEFLTEDEIGPILEIVHRNYKEYYEGNFPNLIRTDNGLVKYLWLSIKRSWMKSGSKVGYSLSEYQFYPGLEKEVVKNRLNDFDLIGFDENQKKIIALFEKAYNDGFKEKKYYDIETLEDIGIW